MFACDRSGNLCLNSGMICLVIFTLISNKCRPIWILFLLITVFKEHGILSSVGASKLVNAVGLQNMPRGCRTRDMLRGQMMNRMTEMCNLLKWYCFEKSAHYLMVGGSMFMLDSSRNRKAVLSYLSSWHRSAGCVWDELPGKIVASVWHAVGSLCGGSGIVFSVWVFWSAEFMAVSLYQPSEMLCQVPHAFLRNATDSAWAYISYLFRGTAGTW